MSPSGCRRCWAKCWTGWSICTTKASYTGAGGELARPGGVGITPEHMGPGKGAEEEGAEA